MTAFTRYVYVEGQTTRRKNIRIQTNLDTCGQGLICRQDRYVTQKC